MNHSKTMRFTAILFSLIFLVSGCTSLEPPGNSPSATTSASGTPAEASASPTGPVPTSNENPVLSPEASATPSHVTVSWPSDMPDIPLISIPPPVDLSPDETVEASAEADLDADGVSERIHLLRSIDRSLVLRIEKTTGAGGIHRRKIADPDGKTDMFAGPAVNYLLLAHFTEYSALCVAIGFKDPQIGDTQWAIYQDAGEDGIRLQRLEPFAIDTGTILYADMDQNGEFERIQNAGHVIRIHKYMENEKGFGLEFIKSLSTETFDRKDPLAFAQAWLYDLYNRIEPDFSEMHTGATVGFADGKLFTSAYHPDIFTPYPHFRADGSFNGVAFNNGTLDDYQGLPSADASIVSRDGGSVTVRLSDRSEFDESKGASVLLKLVPQTEGTWLVSEVTEETDVTITVASDDNNAAVLAHTPVYLSPDDTASGYGPLRDKLREMTGLSISSLHMEGSFVLADLSADMKLFLNQGSTGSAMRVETLVRTLLSLPGARTVRFTIAGEPDVVMDHYSFAGQYRLDSENKVTFEPFSPLPALANTPESAADILFTALRGKDWETLSRYASVEKGTRLCIYGFCNTFQYVDEGEPILTPFGWLSLTWDDRIRRLGYQAGSGFPIETTLQDHMAEFFMPAAPRSAWKRTTETGSGTSTEQDPASPAQVWPESTRVLFRWDGTEKNANLDWRSLEFVFEKEADHWKLVGLVSNEWTP